MKEKQVMEKQSTPTPSGNGEEEGSEDCESPGASNFFIMFRSPQKPPPEALLDLMGMQRASVVKDGPLMMELRRPGTEEKEEPLMGMKRARTEEKDGPLMELQRARTEKRVEALMGIKKAKTEAENGKLVDLEKKYPFTVRAFTSWCSKGAITPALADHVKANLEAVGREASEEFEAKWKKLHFGGIPTSDGQNQLTS